MKIHGKNLKLFVWKKATVHYLSQRLLAQPTVSMNGMTHQESRLVQNHQGRQESQLLLQVQDHR